MPRRTSGMIPRGPLIAALLVVELAIAGESLVALRGRPFLAWSPPRVTPRVTQGQALIEGGPHHVFEAGSHPALTVDIGYADLTIRTSSAPQIEVSVSSSSSYGYLGSHEPITADASDETIRVATAGGRSWSVGDDRMVTVIVPPSTQVTVVKAGDINAHGLRAEASLHSVGQGSVTVEDYNAPELAASSNGRIALHGIIATHLDATSNDDRVEGYALQLRDGTVESNGRVSLGFATGADTTVNAAADKDGVRTVRVGAGNGRLDVHSSDGPINIAQEH